jgi:hypothetical protein
MKLTYKFTFADWKAALRLHSRQKIGRRIHYLIYDFVIPALAVLALGCMILAYSNGQTETVDDLVVPVMVLVGLAVLLPLLRNSMKRKSFKGLFPSSETGPGYSLDIDDERIVSTRPGIGEATYYWTGICAVAEDNKIMLLYFSEILFLGIPARVLTPEQRVELNDFLVKHVKKRS